MIRRPVRQLTLTLGIVTLFTTGAVLSLQAAPASSMPSEQLRGVRVQVTAPPTTTVPAATEPVVTFTPTVAATNTPKPTATIPPTPTPDPPTATAPPPTPTPSPLPPPPTSTPTPTPAPSLLEQGLALVTGNWMWGTPVCLVVLLILVAVAIILLLRRRRGPTPAPSPPTPPPPPPAAAPYLENVSPPGKQQKFRLNPQGFTIGRAVENDLVITEDLPGWETVSRRHARIFEEDGRWIIEDLQSMNGIYVNGKRTGRNLLRDDWRVDIGGVEFRFRTGPVEATQ